MLQGGESLHLQARDRVRSRKGMHVDVGDLFFLETHALRLYLNVE